MMTADDLQWMTAEGKARLKFVKDAGFEEFYNPWMGNLIIEDSQMTAGVKEKVFEFLRANEDWIFGHEDSGEGDGYYFITTREDL